MTAEYEPLSAQYTSNPYGQYLFSGPARFDATRELDIAKNQKMFPLSWSITLWMKQENAEAQRNLIKETYTDVLGNAITCWGLSFPMKFEYGQQAYKTPVEISAKTLRSDKRLSHQLHMWTFIYNLEEKWAQFGVDGKLEPRINGTAFASEPVVACNGQSRLHIGSQGITLAGVHVSIMSRCHCQFGFSAQRRPTLTLVSDATKPEQYYDRNLRVLKRQRAHFFFFFLMCRCIRVP